MSDLHIPDPLPGNEREVTTVLPNVPRSFTVEMSNQLLAELLDQWSEPVQIKVEADSSERGGYRVTARRVKMIR